ncbi:cellulose synthase subunit BcsC-related outer membrane protein [Alcaligenaceae bacterium C4P045]|nr:cellulose synthase subunit BcsC-related outer membrane protein [Alcaligenaceae bacterium C4P045]
MFKRHRTLAAGMLALALGHAAYAQTDALTLLIQQGQYWQKQSNPERATEAWQKLLRIDPNQPDALLGLGQVALSANQPERAMQYLTQLRSVAPEAPQTIRLQQAIALSQGDGKQKLSEARLAAQAGELDRAVDGYRAALTGVAAPQGQVALEYYERLAYQPANRDEAIAGLARLSRDSPADMEVQLAYAQALTLNPATRVSGIEQLQKLSQRSDIGGAARERWRAGLTFFGEAPPASTAPLFQAYLAVQPDDEDIKKLAANIGKSTGGSGGGNAAPAADPVRLRTAAGFRALDRADLTAAEAEFGAALRARPNDAEALGGLGILRLRQESFAEARALLTRATAQGGGARWRNALDSATYWTLYNQAATARAAGDSAGAQSLLRQALSIDAESAAAQNAMAELQVASGRLDLAQAIYERVLNRHPNDAQAVRGLAEVLAESGQTAQAQAFVSGLSASQRVAQGDGSQLKAAVSGGAARAAMQRGDVAAAQTALQQAVRDDPLNPWLNAELARVYLKRGDTAEARRVMGALTTRSGQPQSLYASAMIAAEAGDQRGALATLGTIAPSDRTPEMAQFEKRVWVRSQAELASRMSQSGRRLEAIRLLGEALPYANQDPDMLGAVASAYVDVGDTPRALNLLRGAMGTQPTPALKLQYAQVLLKAGQDVELVNVLRDLQAQPLSRADQVAYDDLRARYVIRQADALRERGDLVAAYDTLSPVLAEKPEDVGAVGALARMYAAAGDYPQALDLYKQLQARNADSLDVQLGAAQMATQLKDYAYAEQAIDRALTIAPRNADVLTAAARLYRDQGKTGKAADFFKQALAARGSNGTAAPLSANAATSANPFVGLPGQRAQAAANGGAAAVPVPAAFAPRAGTAGGYLPPPVAAMPPTARYAAPGAAAPQYAAYAAGATAPPYGAPANLPSAYDNVPNYGGGAPVPPGYGGAAYPAPGYGTQPAMGNPAGGNAPLSIQDELNQLLALRSPTAQGGVLVRQRKGEKGTSNLVDVQTPTTVRYPAGDGMLAVTVTPTTLNAGRVSNTDNAAARFGGGPQASLAQPNGDPGKQRDSGVGLSVGYEKGNLAADIGSTPIGFRYPTVVGGVKVTGAVGDVAGLSYQAEVSRRAVTDSVLSFAGARDNRTGQSWGGVTANGARVQLVQDYGDAGVYGYGSFHSLVGHNVESNTRAGAGVGVYTHLLREADRQLTTGVNLTATGYDKNLRYFTYGHGGYFSPQEFYALSVPVSWSQRGDRFSYLLKGSLGVQRFKEDGAAYFPGSSGLQAASGDARYDGQSKTGLGYNVAAAGEYRISPRLSLGGALSMDNASDYRQWIGGLYARYTFETIAGPLALPIEPFRSPYGP